ncbi:MAG TPA: CDP-alcohol phosphatidyltransferase family protein [Nitrososphaerales archaeon]|nr:CDP-alcohol phosphatidyltransferase family protein [Nitrososphaerales archaeon]
MTSIFGVDETTVLNKIRTQVEPIVNSIGRSLGRTGLSPTFWTFLGFLFSVLAGILYALRPEQPFLAAFSLVISGLFDILDGAVARVNRLVSKSGSFNDSTLDRLAEVAVYSGIIYAGYTSSLFVLLALSFSLLVSYTRAKGDSLGVSLSGIGIGERAERLLVLIVFSIAGFVWIGVIVVLIIAIVTFLQRYVAILKKLR